MGSPTGVTAMWECSGGRIPLENQQALDGMKAQLESVTGQGNLAADQGV